MRVVFFTGAGLSAESGLPTYRGEGGLYQGIRAEEVLSAQAYRRDPGAIEQFMLERRTAMRLAEPNAAHRAIADYAIRHPQTVVLTQNIDDLLERAGAPEVVHLHGKILELRCLGHNHTQVAGTSAAHLERCLKCGSRMRSNVVLFGEAAPEYATLKTAIASQAEPDVMVVVGTQGGVIPIGRVLPWIRGFKALVNLDSSPDMPEQLFDKVIMKPASEGVPEILAILEAMAPSASSDSTTSSRDKAKKRAAFLWKRLMPGTSTSPAVR